MIVILHRLLESAVLFCHTPYDNCLFQAMCSLAFFACRRVGEITLATTRGRGSPIQLHQLTQLVDANQGVIALKFTFLDFKHNYNQRPFSVVINRRNNFCPVQIILDYLTLGGGGRGECQGPFFAWRMVPLSQDLCLLTSFPWPLSIVGLTLLVIKVIAFV